jgi:hypothetical protein
MPGNLLNDAQGNPGIAHLGESGSSERMGGDAFEIQFFTGAFQDTGGAVGVDMPFIVTTGE